VQCQSNTSQSHHQEGVPFCDAVDLLITTIISSCPPAHDNHWLIFINCLFNNWNIRFAWYGEVPNVFVFWFKRYIPCLHEQSHDPITIDEGGLSLLTPLVFHCKALPVLSS
jgi:hypothetical protein